jgi:hypothetical protein
MTEFVLRLAHAEGGSALATGNEHVMAELVAAVAEGRMRKGGYLKHADIEAFDGRGDATFTASLAKAKRFSSFDAALAFWKRQSKLRPYRDDGLPNRPLTAFSMTVETVPDEI